MNPALFEALGRQPYSAGLDVEPMPLYLAVDDTDSRDGMCTTFLATELVRALSAWDLIGFPRLVRLNPNVPWKTRGNGAICLRLGRGRGPRFIIGEIEGRQVVVYPRGDEVPIDALLIRIVQETVEAWSRFDDPTTNPAFVVLRRPPSPRLYWRAVRTLVKKEEALEAIGGLGLHREYKNGRGVIGAAAAAAWRPRDRTYEALAYRRRDRWGTPRRISRESVRRLDAAFPSTFNNYDWEDDRIVIAPRTPCPVLCGIRGDDPWELPVALAGLRGEVPDRWLLFETNQGTDDHVIENPAALEPRTSVSIIGTVMGPPRTVPGGHVVVRLRGRHEIDVLAYEPSKGFRAHVRALASGDVVRVLGSIREQPRSLNLEKFELLAPATVVAKVGNPKCPACTRRMKSAGRRGPYRCRRCGMERPQSDATFAIRPRSVLPGWYEPPAGSRRHLSKPLKRMGDADPRKESVVGRPSKRASPKSLAEPYPCLLPSVPNHGGLLAIICKEF